MALGERTALFNRMEQRGVYDITSIGGHPGAVFFVDSGHTYASDAAGFGKSPDSPVATIDYAVSLCTASQGDVIYVMPGHTETIATAGALALDVAGIHVIGIGNGTIQPILTMTDDAATITIGAANVTLEDVNIQAASDDVAVMLDVNADDFTLRGCRFTMSASAKTGTICVQDALATASDRITVENCHVIMDDAANTHFFNMAGTGDGHIVRNNILHGDWGTISIGGAGIVTYPSIYNNYCSNAATDDDSFIDIPDTSPGLICNNRYGFNGAGNSTASINAIVASVLENYCVDIGDRSGVLDPAAT